MAVDAWVDGEPAPVAAATARIAAAPAGVFETLLVRDGLVARVDAHGRRLASGARALGLAWPTPARWQRSLAPPAQRAGTFVLRVALLEDGTCVALARPFEATDPRGVVLLFDPLLGLDEGDPARGHKVLERGVYGPARAAALQRGAFDALLCNRRGGLAEGSITNLFLLREGVLWTPPVSAGALPGVARALLLAGAQAVSVRERELDRADLEEARELLLTNAVHGVLGVRELLLPGATRRLPGAQGPLARSWAGIWASSTEASRGAIVDLVRTAD